VQTIDFLCRRHAPFPADQRKLFLLQCMSPFVALSGHPETI
jgi:hypothetical protein